MSVPSGVDANAANIYTATISPKSTANVRIHTKIVVENTNAVGVSVNCYVVIDGNLVDALPLYFNPLSQYRQEFTSRVIGLAGGDHSYQLYAGATMTGVDWSVVDADWDMFYA